jgi:hypothetical protein
MRTVTDPQDVTVPLDLLDNTVFTPQAVAGLVGQEPMLTAHTVGGDVLRLGRLKVVEANLEADGRVSVTLRIPDTPTGREIGQEIAMVTGETHAGLAASAGYSIVRSQCSDGCDDQIASDATLVDVALRYTNGATPAGE